MDAIGQKYVADLFCGHEIKTFVPHASAWPEFIWCRECQQSSRVTKMYWPPRDRSLPMPMPFGNVVE